MYVLRAALREIEAQLNALSELRELPSGSIRLAAGRHAVETVLWAALLRLNTLYPDTKVQVSIDPALTVMAIVNPAHSGLVCFRPKTALCGSISLLIRIAIPAWGNQLPEYGRQMTAVDSATSAAVGNVAF